MESCPGLDFFLWRASPPRPLLDSYRTSSPYSQVHSCHPVPHLSERVESVLRLLCLGRDGHCRDLGSALRYLRLGAASPSRSLARAGFPAGRASDELLWIPNLARVRVLS